MLVVQLDTKHGAGQHGENRSFQFDGLFTCHKKNRALTGERNPTEIQEVFVPICLIYHAIYAKNPLYSTAKSEAGVRHSNSPNPIFLNPTLTG
jgi:hypothetical protein